MNRATSSPHKQNRKPIILDRDGVINLDSDQHIKSPSVWIPIPGTWCPHRPADGCLCRKPAPGMLNEMLDKFNADPAEVVMAGDITSDYNAAMAAGINFVLLRSRKGLRTTAPAQLPTGVLVFEDLATYVDHLLDAFGKPPDRSKPAEK